MNFSFFPYGNAEEHKQGSSWRFSCQHGAKECKANTIMACAMHYHPNASNYFPFIECMESSRSPVNAGQSCANKEGWSDWSSIKSCSTSDMGNKLMHIIAVATDSLVPRHKWTPWVVMNGKPLTDHQLDQHLSKLVCDAYQGSDKPPACSSATMSNKLCLKE